MGERTGPLHERHVALGAAMTDFGGWLMPLHYGSVLAEHRAVREDCGVFDVSHLGRLLVRGDGADAAVSAVLTNDVAALAPGRAQYSLCLDEAGGIVDDVLVYRLTGGWSDGLLVVPNAANAAAVAERLRHAAPAGTQVRDVQDELACLAVQGPRSAEVVEAIGIPVARYGYLDCFDMAGAGVVARSGYTGERGYELFCLAEHAPVVWDRLLAAGAAPAGLGARDTLRLEMGYPLHGSDIGPGTSPVEAGLTWAVKGEHDFTGRAAYEAAKAAGPRRRLRGVRVEGRGIPRAHCAVWRGGERVGELTSGTFSPTLGVGIGMGYLAAGVDVGARVEIEVRGKRLPAAVVAPPFVDRNPRT
ncbi:MAG TPA: glycine cleavage system aminomethyltransferase GcvT [Egibacteraceae bacterium]|nr:glycine cleavage system aminomethyltransferase GcvT [Egibacteraceae bacterium]